MQRSITGVSQLLRSSRQSQNAVKSPFTRAFRRHRSFRASLRTLAAKQETKTVEVATSAEEGKDEASSSTPQKQGDIKVSLEKSDVEPKEERTASSLNDDEEKYPSKSELVGGWAGGEIGLQQFIEEAQKDGEAGSPKEGAQPAKAEAKATKAVKGPKQVDDEPGKYPSKESIGPFPGITGGFAGGEKGVQQYVEKGDVELVPEGRSRPQFSPLIIAGGAAVAAVLGGLLLDDGVKLGEEAVESGSSIPGLNLTAAPIDDNTRLLLQVAIALLGVVGVSIGVRAVVRQVQEGTGKLAERLLDLGKIGAFWIGVFIAVKFVLESS